jgi:putative transposon-encoded protein
MKEFDKQIKGELTLQKIEFNRVIYRKVIKSNERGSKISVPKELENKFVYIVVPKEKV